MASSVSPLSYLDPAAYLSAMLPSATPSTLATGGVSATAEVQAMQQEGNFQSMLNDSVAVALLQPATGVNSGTTMTTLVNNMLQQVLGAYQVQMNSS